MSRLSKRKLILGLWVFIALGFGVISPNADADTGLGEAVDNTQLVWTTGGSANWFDQSSFYYYDVDAARTGYITAGQQTYIQSTVTCSGTFAFYWKVSSENGCDHLRFYIDGNEQNAISGAVDWTKMSYFIPAGIHTLKWVYAKDGSVDTGNDCGWLDKVEFSNNSGISGVISYLGTKTGTLHIDAFASPAMSGTPSIFSIKTNPVFPQTYTVTIVPGTYYIGAYIDADNDGGPTEYDPGDIYGTLSAVYYPYQIIGTPTPVNVYNGSNTSGIDFALSHEVKDSLGEAVDNIGFSWRTGRNASWFRQTDADYSYYDGDAAQSGNIGDNQQTYIQTQVAGAGTLTFYWKVSSESGYDYLRFYIDGYEQSKISSEADWMEMSYFIPSGTHTLKWAYTKNSSGSGGSDCGWIDRLDFSQGKITGVISCPEIIIGTLYYSAFDNPQWTGTPIAEGTRTFSGPGTVSYELGINPGTYYLRVYIDDDNNKIPTVGDPADIYGSLSTVYYPWHVIGTPTAVNVYNGSNASDIDFVLNQEVEEKVFLDEAVDTACKPNVTTGGDADWFDQTVINYENDEYGTIQSGDIMDNQQTYIQATVRGHGTLIFHWKVSSESEADYLVVSEIS